MPISVNIPIIQVMPLKAHLMNIFESARFQNLDQTFPLGALNVHFKEVDDPIHVTMDSEFLFEGGKDSPDAIRDAFSVHMKIFILTLYFLLFGL